MKYLVAILSAALLVLGILVYYQGRSAERAKNDREADNLLHQQRVSQIQASLIAAKDSVKREKAHRHKTDSLNKVSENALKSQIRVRDKKLSELRVPVASLIDSVKELGKFIAAYDSSLASRDSLIVTLTVNNQEISASYEREIDLLEHQIDTLQAANVSNLGRVSDLERSLNKAEKKARKKLGFGISAGWGLQENNGVINSGPSINAGVHWTPFRF